MIVPLKRGDTMSYETMRMEQLTSALRDTDSLTYAIRALNDNIDKLEDLAEELGKFNENIIILERLAMAIEKQNELLEQSTKPKIRTLTNEPSVFNVTVTNNKKSE